MVGAKSSMQYMLGSHRTGLVSPDYFYIATTKMAEESERLREAMEQLRCKPSRREEYFSASDFMIGANFEGQKGPRGQFLSRQFGK